METEPGSPKNGVGAAEVANSLKMLAESVKPPEPQKVSPRKSVSKNTGLHPETIEKKQAEIVTEAIERTRKNTPKKGPVVEFPELPVEAQMVNLAQIAAEDTTFLAAGQAEAVKKKLLDLRTILISTPPGEQVEKLTSFFNQADNWTSEVAPYMSLARKAVMRHLYIQPPEPYNARTAEELVNRAEKNFQDYTDTVDWEMQRRENPSVVGAIEDEEINADYNPVAGFEELTAGGTVPRGMENIVHDWNERLALLHEEDLDKRQDYWDVFTEGRLKNDIKDIEDLVRQNKISNAEALPWQNAINKYLRAREGYRRSMRQGGRAEGNTITAQDIRKTQPGYWEKHKISPPDIPFTFSYYVKADEVEQLKQPNGEYLWFKKHLLDKISVPRAESQPTFTEGIKLEEVEHFLEWKYGEEDGRVRKHLMKRIRTGVEHAHQLNKLFTTEGLAAEKMLEVYMQLTPDDLDFLVEFKDVNRALPIYENVIIRLLSKRRARWYELKYGNAKQGILSKEAREYRLKALEEDIQYGAGKGWDESALRAKIEAINKGDIEQNRAKLNNPKLGEKEKVALRSLIQEQEQRVQVLKDRLQNKKLLSSLDISDVGLERARLQEEKDDLDYGVALWDSDWNYSANEFSKLREKHERIRELRSRPVLTNAEQKDLNELDADNIEYQSLMHRRSLTPEQKKRVEALKKRMDAEQDILENEGLSAIEIQVKKEMMLQKEVEIRKKLRQSTLTIEQVDARVSEALGDEESALDTKMAILMARYNLVYTRHVVSIAANFRILGEGTKAVMRAPVLEDLERFYAWQTFFERFNMGADAGKTALAIYNREAQFHKYDTPLKLSKSKFWEKLAQAAERHPEQQASLDAIAKWEEASGMSFAQVLNNEILKAGGVFDGSVWRAEIGITDEVRKDLVKFVDNLRAQAKGEGNNAVVDILGLAYQFAAESPLLGPDGKPCTVKDKGATINPKRLYLLEKQRQRDPLLFMEFLVDERVRLLESGFTSATGEAFVDFDILGEALTLAQNDINLDKMAQVAPDIDLGGKDFAERVLPYLEQILHDRGISADTGQYQEFIQKMMKIAREKAPEWAKTDFPLTLRMGDLDWHEVSYHKAGTLAMPRRGRDNIGMYKAAAIMRDIMSNSELLFAADPTKLMDKLVEMNREIIGYAGQDTAEFAVKTALSTYLKMNENRLRRKFPVGWLPGTEWALRQISEMPQDRFEAVVKKMPKWLFRLVGVKPENIDAVKKGIAHQFNGRAVSYAVEYGSRHGNAFDEKTIATIIATAQDRGLFQKNKRFAYELMDEHQATLIYRIRGAARKYWWVAVAVIVATVLAASLKEQEKSN